MPYSSPRHVHNNLSPISLDEESLRRTLSNLQSAVTSAMTILRDKALVRLDRDDQDPIYTGNSGIALMLLRLAVQFDAAGLEMSLGREFSANIPSMIFTLLPRLSSHRLKTRHISPLDSTVGPALVYVLTTLEFPSSKNQEENEWATAVTTLTRAVEVAIEDKDNVSADEILYGRAGLLWAMLNLEVWHNGNPGRIADEERQDLEKVVGMSLVDKVFGNIIEAGDAGATMFEDISRQTELPLLWKWHGKLYLGAIHGVAGILTVLLQAPRAILHPHLPKIISSVTALCRLSTLNNGHLPSSLPAHSRTHPLVQICHGSPGLLLLLNIFRTRFPQEWKADWKDAEKCANDAIWREGLVTKGLGLCHGVTGNAWPWLLQARDRRGTPEGDLALSRALAFLLHARNLSPMPAASGTFASAYRTPDHPYSLFEGLAGAVCAWLEACIIIRERLGEIPSSGSQSIVLGIPGMGGARVHGFL